jgi:hypothetical protein
MLSNRNRIVKERLEDVPPPLIFEFVAESVLEKIQWKPHPAVGSDQPRPQNGSRFFRKFFYPHLAGAVASRRLFRRCERADHAQVRNRDRLAGKGLEELLDPFGGGAGGGLVGMGVGPFEGEVQKDNG